MPGARHGGVCGRLAIALGMYLKANRLGELYPETNFQIGGNERIPDLAFVSAARLPPEGEPESKWPIPPDLAVEVISPNDLYKKRYAFGIPRHGVQRSRLPDAMPQRQHTPG
jgi:Uma2 family endonuclease